MSAPDQRPSPEALLERIRSEDAAAERARLKIFFGASAGVGKTYAMLVEAHEKRTRGTDVVVGLVETHGTEMVESRSCLQVFQLGRSQH